MKLLLDTQLLLWVAGEPERLSPAALSFLASAEHVFFFSAASLWEIAIKSALGREDFKVDAHLLQRSLLDNGYLELSVTGRHAVAVSGLPPIHKDPFDRLLLAQAQTEGFLLLTSDAYLAQYPGPVRQV